VAMEVTAEKVAFAGLEQIPCHSHSFHRWAL